MVEQLARELSEALIKSQYGQALIEAKKAYDADDEAKQLLQDYVNKQNAFQNKLAMGTVTDEEKDAYYDEINAQYEGSKSRHEAFLAKKEAELKELTK